MLTLYIGNKNYSSWSMRPWVLLRHFGIPFREVMVRFDSFDAGSEFRNTMNAVSPTGKVPLLVHDDVMVWDTLAIAEGRNPVKVEGDVPAQRDKLRIHTRMQLLAGRAFAVDEVAQPLGAHGTRLDSRSKSSSILSTAKSAPSMFSIVPLQ